MRSVVIGSGWRARELRLETKLARVVEEFIDLHLGLQRIGGIEIVSNGLVHRVFRFRVAAERRIYLKIRGDSWSSAPSISIKPEDVAYEARALELYGARTPDLFPALLAVDARHGLLLLGDAAVNGHTLMACFQRGMVCLNEITLLARNPIRVHTAIASLNDDIRPQSDQGCFEGILRARFGFSGLQTCSRLIKKLAEATRQLILGGLSPKNILIGASGGSAFCDLETACRGSPAFDVGFCLGHVLLHLIRKPKYLGEAVKSFLAEYDVGGDIDHALVAPSVLATLHYRLEHPNIAYQSGLDKADAAAAATTVRALLSAEVVDLGLIVKTLGRVAAPNRTE